jgi:hypothetical protein
METPLNALSTTAGALMSSGRFRVPQFQREYAWEKEEVAEFFQDLSGALEDETYFLGLVIVTGEGQPKDVVDGQQRLLTITLLASALYHEAKAYERRALAERLQSTFLRFIDFESDKELPRLELSSAADQATLLRILDHPANDLGDLQADDDTVSGHLISAYRLISNRLAADLGVEPFKRLGAWAEFLMNKLYLAEFVHPNPASAYRVFEVINTRGKELTTADLLKNYVLSQTPPNQRETRYEDWQLIASAFSGESPTTFVQFIRHCVTTRRGHVLPRDLYDVLAGRGHAPRKPMTPQDLVSLMQQSLPAYLQMMDPTREGPANEQQLAVYSVLNRIGVVSIRPILLSMMNTRKAGEGMESLLRLVVRRIVVGNLGTGNIERRFGQAAQKIAEEDAWESALEDLSDLDHDAGDFSYQVLNRSMNRGLLSVIRQSVIQGTITPEPDGYLYFIRPRGGDWPAADQDRAAYWASTIGNSFLSTEARRPMGSSSWSGFKRLLLPTAVEGEWVEEFERRRSWNVKALTDVGQAMADEATRVWYD